MATRCPPVPTRVLLFLDAADAAGLAPLFTAAGYVVESRCDNDNAPDCDLVVFDLDVPQHGGQAVLDHWRSINVAVPVLALSASTAAGLAALEAGADGFVQRPVAARELLARADAVIRHCGRLLESTSVIAAGELRLDSEAGSAHVGNRQLALTAKPFALLAILARRPGLVITRASLLDQLYVGGDPPTERTIDVFVHGIRRQLAAAGSATTIATVRGIGFSLRAAGLPPVC